MSSFIIIQLAASFVLDYVRPDIRFPLLKTMLSQLEREPRSPDVVILGSSRFQKAINPAEMTNEVRSQLGDPDFRVFHGAVGASDAIAMELALNEVLARGHRPKMVIIEVTPTTLTKSSPWYVNHIARQIPWHETPRHLIEITQSGQLGRWIVGRLFPLYRHRYETRKAMREVINLFPNEKPREAPMADGPRPVMDEAEFNRRLTARALTPDETNLCGKNIYDVKKEIRHFSPESSNIDAMKRMLQRCHEFNIKVLIVGAPVSSAYRQAIASVEPLYESVMSNLVQTDGVAFVNHHASVPDHHFYDYHHTTNDGGAAFTRLLTRKDVIPRLK